MGVAFPRLEDGVLSISTVEFTHFACLAFCKVSYKRNIKINNVLTHNKCKPSQLLNYCLTKAKTGKKYDRLAGLNYKCSNGRGVQRIQHEHTT